MDIEETLAQLCAEHPRYRHFYINYEELKRTVQNAQATAAAPKEVERKTENRALSHQGVRGDLVEAQFTELLRHQLEKINNFVELQWEVISGELKMRMRTSDAIGAEALGKLGDEITHLDTFIRVNHTGFQKITEYCDGHCKTEFTSWFMPRVDAAPFRQWDFDVLFVQLGILYARQRQSEADTSAPSGTGVAETLTLFVPPERVASTKVLLLRHLHPGAPQAGAQQPAARKAPGDRRRRPSDMHTTLALKCFRRDVAQVYFDNDKGSQYAERRRRLAGEAAADFQGEVFFVGWTGENKGSADVVLRVAVEDASGTTTEVTLKQRHMAALVGGSLDVQAALCDGFEEPTQGQVKALEAVQATIKNSALRPMLSVNARRAEFVNDCSDFGASATIDEDLIFADDGADGKAWCHAAQGVAPEGRTAALPEAVLRVSVPTECAGADWVKQLRADPALRPIPGFSESMHGMAFLHTKVANPAPAWLAPEALAASKAATARAPSTTLAKEEKAIKEQKPKAAPVAIAIGAGAGAPPPSCWARTAALLPWRRPARQDMILKVDPKTPMANERTALRWLRSAVLLSSLSAFLSSQESDASRLNGLLLGVVALLFVFLPIIQFRKRSMEYCSAKAHQPQADRSLPQALSLSLVVILTAVLIIDVFCKQPITE